ncbi:Cell division cycle and apoptosis regulator protein 1 [Homalodisca vitripennis]|nr:Cell division cycle and apoptosis regulator protein 1 [Homalodisca vitripennis]
MRKVCVKLVPNVLSKEQKLSQGEISPEIFDCIQEVKNFLDNDINGDESWVFQGLRIQKKLGYQNHADCFFDRCSIVYKEFVPAETTIKKLVQKVISRDSLHYRKLTDKPKDDPTAKQNGAQTTEDLMTLALGNKRLFPIFEEAATPSKRSKKGSDKKAETPDLPSGFVMFNGSLLDINKLQSQFKRSEETRVKTEKLLEKLRSDNANLKETTNRNVATIKKLSSELKDFKERLTNTNSELCTMDSKTKLYFAAMSEIYEKLGPILAQKPVVKEEIIEDVEMEDAMENANAENKQAAKLEMKKEVFEKSTRKVEKDVETKLLPQENTNNSNVEAQKLESKTEVNHKKENVVTEKTETDLVKENTNVKESNQEDKNKKPVDGETEEKPNQPESKAEVAVENPPSTPEPKIETKVTAQPSRSSPRQLGMKAESQTTVASPNESSQTGKEFSSDSKEQPAETKVDEKCSTGTTVEPKLEEKPSPSVRNTRSREIKVEDKKTPVKK